MVTEYGDPIPEFPAPGVPAEPIHTPVAPPPEPEPAATSKLDNTTPEVTSAAVHKAKPPANTDANDPVDGGVGTNAPRGPDS
jgi:hypothetical protein